MNIFKVMYSGLSCLRECVWPLLEKEDKGAKPDEIDVVGDNIIIYNKNEVLGFLYKCYDIETERKRVVETKSSLFIGTLSVVISLIIGVTSFLFQSQQNNANNSNLLSILMTLLFVITIYLCRTLLFSIRALERKSYHTLDAKDAHLYGNHRILVKKISNIININKTTINKKVDYMTMAQEYFKRAIYVICIYSALILLYYLDKNYSFLNSIVHLFNSIRNHILI